jgi:biopolymer transport protein ExbB/TolQ
MKNRLSAEFLFQLSALLIAVIVVHGAYVGVIRPSAEAQLEEQFARQAAGEEFVPDRSLAVVIRDFEQEACFILLIWALSIMAYKARQTVREQSMLDRNLIDIPEGTSVLPPDAREYSRGLEELPAREQEYLLPRTLLAALQRFATTGSIQAVSDTIRESCEVESDRLDSELSMVRYIAWAIPSIGFIGTVRGIGDALGQAYKAVEGDISGVTCSRPRSAWFWTVSAMPTSVSCVSWWRITDGRRPPRPAGQRAAPASRGTRAAQSGLRPARR